MCWSRVSDWRGSGGGRACVFCTVRLFFLGLVLQFAPSFIECVARCSFATIASIYFSFRGADFFSQVYERVWYIAEVGGPPTKCFGVPPPLPLAWFVRTVDSRASCCVLWYTKYVPIYVVLVVVVVVVS